MDSQEHNFLESIRAAPEDDAPRLVFADWLEEQGDPRCDLIRVQCEMAQLEETDDRYKELKYREREILRRHEPKWLAPVAHLPIPGHQFRRGFIEQVELDAELFCEKLPEVTAALPMLRSVHVQRAVVFMAEVANCPHLSMLEELDLSRNVLTNEALSQLTASPALKGLRGLNLSGNGLEDLAMEYLGGCRYLTSLEKLTLRHNAIGVKGVTALTRRLGLRGLKVLDLGHNRLGPSSMTALANARCLGKLETLSVAGNDVDLMSLETVLNSPQLPALSTLHLRGTPLGAASLERLKMQFGDRVTLRSLK